MSSTTLQDARAEAERLPKLPTRRVDHIPGDDGLPIFGNTLWFLRDYPGLIRAMAKRYGPVHRSSVLFQRGINLLGPDANEFVLKDRDHNFSNKLAWNPVLEKIFPNGLMLRDFDEHKLHRKVLQQAFKKQAIEGYITQMNPRIREGIDHWPHGRTIAFFDHIKTLLLSVGAEVFLGVTDMRDTADKVNKAFIATVDASVAVFRMDIPGTLWGRAMAGRRYLEQFITGLIAEKRRNGGDDFFAQIVKAADEDELGLTDEEIRDHIIFLLFAAHDTTTSTLCSVVYALAKHPEWQDILKAEFDALGTENPTFEDLEKMEKASLVFHEALRMYPPLPTIPRRAIRDMEFQGHRIPRNALVSVSPQYTHYMPDYWSNPYRFDPERFNSERAEDKTHFYQFIPFGGGSHKCLGLNFAEVQSKIVLFHLLRHYRVTVKPGYDMKYSIVPLAFPKDGLKLKIEKR